MKLLGALAQISRFFRTQHIEWVKDTCSFKFFDLRLCEVETAMALVE